MGGVCRVSLGSPLAPLARRGALALFSWRLGYFVHPIRGASAACYCTVCLVIRLSPGSGVGGYGGGYPEPVKTCVRG